MHKKKRPTRKTDRIFVRSIKEYGYFLEEEREIFSSELEKNYGANSENYGNIVVKFQLFPKDYKS